MGARYIARGGKIVDIQVLNPTGSDVAGTHTDDASTTDIDESLAGLQNDALEDIVLSITVADFQGDLHTFRDTIHLKSRLQVLFDRVTTVATGLSTTVTLPGTTPSTTGAPDDQQVSQNLDQIINNNDGVLDSHVVAALLQVD